MNIAGIPVRNTLELFSPATRLCAIVYSPAKVGKTKFASTLNKLTKRIYGKPTLIIAVEAADGGGTATIQEEGVDFVQPVDRGELDKILVALQSDTHYGGVVLDSATDTVKRFIQPFVLSIENRKEKDATRALGVPGRSDYQTMGELMRVVMQRLINLTTLMKSTPSGSVPDMDRRKHVLVTALEKIETQHNDVTNEDEIVAIGPDLPGAMMRTSTAMFQQVLNMKVETVVERDKEDPRKTKQVSRRVLISEAEGRKIVGDRFKIFPPKFDPDFDLIYEQFWVPKLAAQEALNGAKTQS